VVLCVLVTAAQAEARPDKRARKIRDIEKTTVNGRRIGTTIWMDLESAPFPHAKSKHSDPTVIVFVPRGFGIHKNMKVDTWLHFHGHRDTAERAMKRHQLREQLYESKQNAILIIPQGPVRSESSDGGKLDEKRGLVRLLTEVRTTLQSTRLQVALGPSGIHRRARIGRLILSAHSGGFKVLANCLKVGRFNVNEVWLFDALYGKVAEFRDWISSAAHHRKPEHRHKFINYYSGPTLTKNTKRLLKDLKRLRIEVAHESHEGELSRKELASSRVVFIRSKTSHQGMVFKNNAVRDCLFASCFKRYRKSRWFKNQEGPRKLDRRR
jgi:hypothetical protein